MMPIDPGSLISADGGATTLPGWLWGGGAGTLLLGLLGYIVKRNRSSANLEDTTNDVTVETVRSQRDRINELMVQLRESMQREVAAVQAQIQAEGNAARSALQAERASQAAQEAQNAAANARQEADDARRRLSLHADYISKLRQTMMQHGLEMPALPE